MLHELVNLPFVAFSPSSIAIGIEAWTWLIGERPDMEIPLMTEVDAGWAETIKRGTGLFSKSMKYVQNYSFINSTHIITSSEDPFIRPIEYAATDKTLIDGVMYAGKRLLSPHTQLLQMLLSRFQSVRYRRSGLMLVFLRLILRSTRAHTSFRYDSCLTLEPRIDLLLVPTPWPGRDGSPS